MNFIITVKQIYDAYLFILPFSDLSKDTKLEKCVKKVKILMQRYNIQSLVAEDNLKQSEKFKKIIEPETKKIHILTRYINICMEFLSYNDKRCYFLFLSFNNLFN